VFRIFQGVFGNRRFFRLKKVAMSFMLCYPRVNGTLSGSDVHLIATAGDSVYTTRCCRVSFVLRSIQMFVNFPCRFIYGSDAVFFQKPTDAISYVVDIRKKCIICFRHLMNSVFVARMQGSGYLCFGVAILPESLVEVFHLFL
jgi:hypothetical protein